MILFLKGSIHFSVGRKNPEKYILFEKLSFTYFLNGDSIYTCTGIIFKPRRW